MPTIKDSEKPHVFESDELKMYSQGFVLYETNLEKGNYSFEIVVHDFAIVYVNGKFSRLLDRSVLKTHLLEVKADQ